MDINWDALDVLRDLDRARRRLERLENKPLMEHAIITSNTEMFRDHMRKIKSLKQEISNLENKLQESAEKFKKEKAEEELARELARKERKEKEEADPGPFDLRTDSDEEAVFESTPLEDFEFADDMSDFENLANDLDEQGFFEAANEIDSLIQKTAKKAKTPGRNFAGWLRQLKKMQASSKVVDKFRKAYKGALEHAKKRKNYNPNRAEEYAMRTAVDGLPKKYLKEPTKLYGPEKKGPVQKADDASELATKLKLDVSKLKKLTPKQLQSVKKIRNPGLARQWAEQYVRLQSAKSEK
jgi:hypothetical protein